MPAATACPSDWRASNLGRAELGKAEVMAEKKKQGYRCDALLQLEQTHADDVGVCVSQPALHAIALVDVPEDDKRQTSGNF